MKLTALFSVATLALSASAAVVDKRQTADPLAIVQSLQSALAAPEAELKTALDGVDTTNAPAVVAAVTPALTEIQVALAAAGAQLPTSGARFALAKRQATGNETEAVAQLIATIITDLIEALGALEDLAAANPVLATLLGPLLTPLDLDLAIILTGLGIVLAGVLALVSDLLSGLAGALSGLGGATSGVLGL